MPDFTATGGYVRTPCAISNYGETLLGDFARYTVTAYSASAWTTANTAVFCPFTVPWAFLAKKMGVQVTTQSGNMDIGIYDEKGTRLVSMGSQAVGAAGVQTFDITDTWLLPGTYFMAMNVDTTAAFFQGVPAASVLTGTGRTLFLLQQAVGAVALPNPATYASFVARTVPLMLVTGATL